MSIPMTPQGGELVDFEAEGEDHWIKLKLKDGSVLMYRSIVSAIFRVGNDPNTGLPIYAIQSSNVVRIVNVPKELIKKKQTSSYG
ncbi:MAG: hypothetical protein QXG05_03120 [Nitrososphaerota archaeon]